MSASPDSSARPVRIPEHVPLCIADPPKARAGETATWALSFTLCDDAPEGSELRLLIHGGRNVKGAFHPIQVTDSTAQGFVRAMRQDGTPVATDPEGTRGGEVALIVPDGGLPAGETIRVILGDGAGITAPGERLMGKMFLLFRPEPEPDLGVPAMNAEPARTILGACLVDVTGGELSALRAYVPSQVVAGEEFSVLVRPEDEPGNLSCEEPGEITVRIDGADIPARREPVAGTTCCRMAGLVLSAPGVYRLEVEDTTNGLTATSNPVVVSDEAPAEQTYWGYIHGHTEMSDGAGTVDNYFTYLRDSLGLDFGALGDHDHLFETTDHMWRTAQEATARYNAGENFVTFLGYEWAKWRQNGDGDRNVYYLGDFRPMYRSDDGEFPNPPALHEALSNEVAMVIPHHPAEIGNHCDYKDYDPTKDRLIEIFSVWGNSERSVNDGNPYPVRPSRHTPGDTPDAGEVPAGFVQRALEIGWRAGFTGGGDDHSGNPGDDRMRGALPWRCRGGLMSVQATAKTRDRIWTGLYGRRCVATTGPRIIVDFTVSGSALGSEVRIADDPDLATRRVIRVSVHGTAPMSRIEVVRNNQEAYVHEGQGLDEEFEWIDEARFEDIALPPTEHSDQPFVFYYLRVTQQDGDMAWASPIWILP